MRECPGNWMLSHGSQHLNEAGNLSPCWWPVDVWQLWYLRYELQKDCAPNPNMSIHSLICNADYIDFWIQLFGPLWPHSISLAGQHWELNYWLTKTKINTHWSGSHIVCFSWFYIILRGSTLSESEIDLLTSNLLHWSCIEVTWKENRQIRKMVW